eukprot:gene17187-biopygen12795
MWNVPMASTTPSLSRERRVAQFCAMNPGHPMAHEARQAFLLDRNHGDMGVARRSRGIPEAPSRIVWGSSWTAGVSWSAAGGSSGVERALKAMSRFCCADVHIATFLCALFACFALVPTY